MLLLFDIVSLLGDNRSMEPKERTLRIFVEHNGKAPFEEWMDTLRDKPTKARICDIVAARRYWQEFTKHERNKQ